MKILSIECSATPCSVAVSENGKVLAWDFTNEKMTHSQTLMPMVKSVLKNANIKIAEIDGFAVSAGPGSFTGIRIGISAVKGMAAARKNPCIAVSTLESMAENYSDTECIVCAVMDARCNQVYNAFFEIKNGEINRLCDDRALLCEEVAKEIEQLTYKGDIIIVGDGANVFYPYVEHINNVSLATDDRLYQNAVSVSFAAEKYIKQNKMLSPSDLQPVYLRLPQAERELKAKKESEK